MNDNASKANLKPIRQRILDQLILLGRNNDEIASALKERGIKGDRASRRFCPIAEYLMEQNSEITNIKVNCVIHMLLNTVPYNIEVHLGLEKFDAILDFIEAFDSGAYPELKRPI